MKSKTALIRGGIFFCVAGALSGCATNSMTRSGFLGDYEKLSPTRYENVLMYRAAGFEPKRYAAVVVEEAQIKTASGRIDGLDDAQQREVLDHVTSELKRQEGKSPAPPRWRGTGSGACSGHRTADTESGSQCNDDPAGWTRDDGWCQPRVRSSRFKDGTPGCCRQLLRARQRH